MNTSNIMSMQDMIAKTDLCIVYSGSGETTILVMQEYQELVNAGLAELADEFVVDELDDCEIMAYEDEIEAYNQEASDASKEIVLVDGIWRWASYEGDVKLDKDAVALVDRKVQELYDAYLASKLFLERNASEDLLYFESDSESYTSI